MALDPVSLFLRLLAGIGAKLAADEIQGRRKARREAQDAKLRRANSSDPKDVNDRHAATMIYRSVKPCG
jgi:hypothetical protein